MKQMFPSRRWASLLLIVVVGLAGSRRATSAELTQPKAKDRQVARIVSSLMSREHLSKRKLNDEIARRALKAFMRRLDPAKIYFTAQDHAEFKKEADQIDDWFKQGDIKFGYKVTKRYLKRVTERQPLIHQLIDRKPDFSKNEFIVRDPEKETFAGGEENIRERFRKRIKYQLMILRNDKTVKKAEIRRKLHRRYESFAKRRHQIDSDEVLEMYLTAITSAFDPHTTYMSPTSLTNFRILMRLELEGIGAALQIKDGHTTVTKVIPGGAADKQGKLKINDRIVSVGQGPEGEMKDVVDLKLTNVVKLIRGKAGSIVRLGILPANGGKTHVYPITRARIELKDSEARSQIIEEGRKENGKPYRVGVIDLPSFYMDMEAARKGVENYKSTSRDCKEILEEFKRKGVDVVVLDLRRNGGGSLTEAIQMTGLFLDVGPVVQVKAFGGRVNNHKDEQPGMTWGGPLVVLTSKFSASASEILAGAIQDYKRGLVVGDQSTHGKGTVQSLLDLGPVLFRIPDAPNFGALKITMQQFYRPNGDSTQKRGVLADVVLPSVVSHMDVGEADLDYAIEFDRVAAAEYQTVNRVSPKIVNMLRQRSAGRRSKSEDFAKLRRNIERYRKQKTKKTITLNEKEYLKQRKQLDADREEEKEIEKTLNNKERPVVVRNYYFNEILAITLDYTKLRGR